MPAGDLSTRNALYVTMEISLIAIPRNWCGADQAVVNLCTSRALNPGALSVTLLLHVASVEQTGKTIANALDSVVHSM